MSRPNLTKEQEEDLQKLNQMNQQIRVMQNQQIQLESQKIEMERTMEALSNLQDEHEIYRQNGQVLFKANVPATREEFKEKLDLLEVRVSQGTKRINDFQTEMKELDSKIRGFLNI